MRLRRRSAAPHGVQAWRQSNEEWNEDPRSSNQKRIADAAKSGKSVQVASSKSASGSKSAKSQRIYLSAPGRWPGGTLAFAAYWGLDC